jgi:hypothetical protein
MLVHTTRSYTRHARTHDTLVHTSGGAISLDQMRAGAYDLKGEIWDVRRPRRLQVCPFRARVITTLHFHPRRKHTETQTKGI